MKKKAFTLIELIAVLVILAILALIVTPLVMNIIRKARVSADKRRVDAYGRSVELAIANYLLDTGTFPTDLSSLTIEYTGKEVVCNVMQMKENGGIYLSECSVNGKEVKDSRTEDGWYHYGTRDLTNEEYVDMYGDALRRSSIAYYEEHENPVEDYRTLEIDYEGKDISCDVTVNYNGTIYMTNCKVAGGSVADETTEDGYYHYGEIVSQPAVQTLLSKANPVTITNYTDGNTSELYTFEHPATAQTPALTDYRYIGATPKNYVYFNDDELWRIIGVFTVEDETGNREQRIKIVRNEKLVDKRKWHYENKTNWSSAKINEYLNTEYYNSLLKSEKNMIAEVKYYLGGVDSESGSAEFYYSSERGVKVKSGNSINWIGRVALLYPSDYIYIYALGVENKCFDNAGKCNNYNGGHPDYGWLYKYMNSWTLISHSTTATICKIDSSGCIQCTGSSTIPYLPSENLYYIFPTLYLSADVKYDSGDGSEQNPYRLKL